MCIYSTSAYLYVVGVTDSVCLDASSGDNPEDVLDVIEGEGLDVVDEAENGDGVLSSKSGDALGGSKECEIKGLPTSLATLTTTSYVFASSRSGAAYSHMFGSTMSLGPSGYAFSRSTDSANGTWSTVGSVWRCFGLSDAV